MIAINMEMPKDCQGCRFCVYVESAMHGGLICSASDNWELLDGEYDKPKWCPLNQYPQIVYCKNCKYYKRVYNSLGCELINYTYCEKNNRAYPHWFCPEGRKREDEQEI